MAEKFRRPGQIEKSEEDSLNHYKFMKAFDEVKSGQMYEISEQKSRELRRKWIDQEKKGIRLDELQMGNLQEFKDVQDLAVPDYTSYMDIDELEDSD